MPLPASTGDRLRESGLLLASGNAHKLAEFQRMLEPRGVRMLRPADFRLDLEVDETAGTFAGNARLKAVAYARAAGRPAVADDSGLVVDALDGAPGVHSARYGGPELDDRGRRLHLLAELERLGVPNTPRDRSARFVCVLALCLDSDVDSEGSEGSGTVLLFEGRAEGAILSAEQGDGGFGYDPVFLDPESGRSFAELSAAEKDARSHRGAALAQLLAAL